MCHPSRGGVGRPPTHASAKTKPPKTHRTGDRRMRKRQDLVVQAGVRTPAPHHRTRRRNGRGERHGRCGGGRRVGHRLRRRRGRGLRRTLVRTNGLGHTLRRSLRRFRAAPVLKHGQRRVKVEGEVVIVAIGRGRARSARQHDGGLGSGRQQVGQGARDDGARLEGVAEHYGLVRTIDTRFKACSAPHPALSLRHTHLLRVFLGRQQHDGSCGALLARGAHQTPQTLQRDRRAGPKRVRFDAQLLRR